MSHMHPDISRSDCAENYMLVSGAFFVESFKAGRAYQAHKRVAVVLFLLAPAAIVDSLGAPLLAHAGVVLNHVITLRAPLLARSKVGVIQHYLLSCLVRHERRLYPE